MVMEIITSVLLVATMIGQKKTWTEKCKYFTSKVGNKMITYFDLDADGYRTAKGSWTVGY